MGLVTVSVPSRGFNSHYIEDVKTKAGRIGRFPSPLGDSILITLATNMKSTAFLVSVPSRGFNSHYEVRLLMALHVKTFPSPLGDSILITFAGSARPEQGGMEVSVPSRGFNSHYAQGRSESCPFQCRFRPLSGIQFSLREYRPLLHNKAAFPSPLGDSILITNK